MTITKLFLLILLVLAGYLIGHKLLPWVAVRVGRLLRFRMKLTPLGARRIQRFKSIKRGYFCFVVLTTLFVLTFFLELFMNHKAVMISYGDQRAYPAVNNWLDHWLPFGTFIDEARAKDYGLQAEGELNYTQYAAWVANPELIEEEAQGIEALLDRSESEFRAKMVEEAAKQGLTYDMSSPLPPHKLKQREQEEARAAHLRELMVEFEAGKANIWMPLYPYSADHSLSAELPGTPPHQPSVFWPPAEGKWPPFLGTDSQGIDVFAQLVYGFRTSIGFALMVSFIGYFVGVLVGGAMGYFGGWFDILTQRFIEIVSSVPFLFTIMIIANTLKPGFWTLAAILVVLRAWIGITYTVRGEFYREKSRDYVQAARAIGVRDPKVMTRHILPNSLVPVVTFMPFEIVAYIGALVSLDFLGFGLPPTDPSWGRLLYQGYENFRTYPTLVYFPVLAFAGTLFFVVTIGEAVREAFDPKKYSRLR